MDAKHHVGEISSSPPDGTVAAQFALEILSNAALDPLFWNSALAGSPSGWHGHVPFAHWLVGALRPSIIVELGTHNGVSYSAFCESVRQIRLSTRCYAVDTWTGDAHAGLYGEEVLQRLRTFHDSRYGGFSELLRMTFLEALAYFADGSVDLLHIDGLHTYEAVKEDYCRWLPKLSKKAVVLFHDTNVRASDFGVWRFWDEISSARLSFEFFHCHGLGVLLVGDEVPDAIASLCQATELMDSNRIRERFAILGQRYVAEYESIAAIERSEAAAERLRVEAGIAQQEIKREMQREAEAREHKLAQAAANLRDELGETVKRVHDLDAELNVAKADLLRVARAGRERRAELQTEATARARESEHDKSILQQELILANRKIAEQKAYISAFHSSTSWRLTSPMRIASLALARQRQRISRLLGRHQSSTHMSQVETEVLALGPEDGDQASSDSRTPYERWVTRFDVLSYADKATIKGNIQCQTTPEILVLAFVTASSIEDMDRWLRSVDQQLLDHWRGVFCFSPDCAPLVMDHLRARIAGNSRYLAVTAALDESDRELLSHLGHQSRILVISDEVMLREHALYCFAVGAEERPDARLFYSDEDVLRCGKRSDPLFKPDFSPELARHAPYLGRCILFQNWERDLDQTVSDILSTGDVAYFASSVALGELGASDVIHIPMVLYHSLTGESRAYVPLPSTTPLTSELPTVSIIIPTKDRWTLLEACLTSLKESDYPTDKFEIIVVDNDTSEPEALRELSAAEASGSIRVIRDRQPFNWSRLNNRAASIADGDVFVFLNNDTEVNHKDWLRRLVELAMEPDVGAVGGKLLYPDQTIQHHGIILGVGGVAGHAFVGLKQTDVGYLNLCQFSREVSAVTGACLAIRRSVFFELGGFDENLRVAFSDVLLCLDSVAAGLRNLCLAEPILVHHESKSRGLDDTPAKVSVFRYEAGYTRSRHRRMFKNDPYYNPNLSLERPYDLAIPPRTRKPWRGSALRLRAPIRLLMLSVTHEIGHGVPVVLHQQANYLADRGLVVFVGGPRGRNEFAYDKCHRVYLDDPQSAACFAAEHDVDCIVAHTPPFFSALRWSGEWPRSIIYDYGEPPPEFFPDADQRRLVIGEKRFCYNLADKVFAISQSVLQEAGHKEAQLLRLGNAHLSAWGPGMELRRSTARTSFGLNGKIVILNICRFHRAERLYKGLDAYVEVMEDVELLRPDLKGRLVFALAGKASEEDEHEMRACGLRVFPNPSDDEMIDLYAAADIYMNFSRWEGYNLGIGQALAMGLPVIASDIPAHREFPIITAEGSLEVVQSLGKIVDAWSPDAAVRSRKPLVYDWAEPLDRFFSEISDLCAVASPPTMVRP